MMFIQENFLLIMTWLLGICISIVIYIAVQNIFPSWMELLLAHTVYAIPGMPNSFLHTIGFYDDSMAHRDLLFWLLCALYWAMLGTVHYWYFEEGREGKYMFVIIFFVIGSSFKWMYYAIAIMNAK